MGEAKRKREQTQRPLKHAPADAVTVLKAANAYRECSRPFCEKLRSLPNQMREMEDTDFGPMIASATNLAFAIELYMKALRILNKLGPMRTHDLATLYANLPKELRLAINATYDAAQKKLDPSQPARALTVMISHKDAPQDDRRRLQVPTTMYDASLPAVLERSRVLFDEWRYLYEQGEHGKVKRVYYEYQWLEAVADALRQHTNQAVIDLAAAEKGEVRSE